MNRRSRPRPHASIDGFDAARWRALDGLNVEQPWQTLPDHVERTSLGRPWLGLKVWHQVGPHGDLYVPPLGNHTILLRRGASTRLLQRQGNAVDECAWQPGMAVVVPTDTPSFWRSEVRRDNIHIDLAPVWLQRASGGRCVALQPCFGRKDAVLSGFAELLLSSLDSNVSLNPDFGEHLAMGIAIHLIENYASGTAPARAPATLSRRQMRVLGDAVADEFDGCWTVARLAALVDLSPFHFALGFTLPAASLAFARAVSVSSARASATPMRRLAKLSGLPNRRRSAPGTARASATPSNTMPWASTPP